MKCPYRILKKIYKGVDNGYGMPPSTDIYEEFDDCIELDCHFFVEDPYGDRDRCLRAEKEVK